MLRSRINPLNTKSRLLHLKANSYRTVNTFHLGYKNQPVYGVSGTSCCLFSDKYETHKYRVGRVYNCWMLNCWCIMWPVGFNGLSNKRMTINWSRNVISVARYKSRVNDKTIIQSVEIQPHFCWMLTARNSVNFQLKNRVPGLNIFLIKSITVRMQATNNCVWANRHGYGLLFNVPNN